MRQVILSNLTSSHLGLRPSCRPHLPINRIRGQCVQSSAKSLDLLRQNVQAAINKEIDSVIKKYLEVSFIPTNLYCSKVFMRIIIQWYFHANYDLH